MSSLRHDLFERRLLLVVVVLIAAIAAVPFLLHGHRTSSETAADAAAPPVAASSGGSSPSAGHGVSVSDRSQNAVSWQSSLSSRDPFQATGAAAHASTSTTGSSVPSTSSITPNNTHAVSSDSTSGAQSSPSSAGSGSVAGAGGVASSEGSSSSGTSTTSTTSTSSSTTTTTTPTEPTGTGPWTIRETSAVVHGQGWTRTSPDLARLTPLPSAATPIVMYVGLSSDGHQSMFALGTGVEPTGPGACLPSKTDCALIGLTDGQVEHFVYLLDDGTERTMSVRSAISSHVTGDASVVSAAAGAHSQIGLCEVELGDPIQFEYDNAGAAVSGTSTSACQHGMKAVPFPGTGSGQ